MEKPGTLDRLNITVLAEDSVLYESPYLGQHGVSFLLEGTSGGLTRNILVDVGQNTDALLANMKTVGIAPQVIDGIVLTHCHYDHTQGVARLLGIIGKKKVPVMAHTGLFRLHFITEPYHRLVGIMPGDVQPEIAKAGGSVSLSSQPQTIMPGMITTGQVPRQTEYEEVRMALKTIDNGRVVDDLMLDDISVIAHVRDKGLVIVTGCSHAGIVNIARRAVAVTGGEKISAIIGGLHLIEASPEVIRKTVAELSRMKVARISAGHCTGFKAQVELYLAFGDKFTPLQTGMRFSF